MNTYTPKIGSMGEPWMMRDPNGGWVSLADHQEALRQANADPNDIEIVSPPPEKVETFKMVPVAEWEAMKQAQSLAEQLEQARYALSHSIVVACAGTGCFNAHELAAALKQARADRDVLAKAVRPVRDIQRDYGVGMLDQMFDWPIDELNAADASGALDRATGGGA